jgi:Tfp pilus assembly major pilin PilA
MYNYHVQRKDRFNEAHDKQCTAFLVRHAVQPIITDRPFARAENDKAIQTHRVSSRVPWSKRAQHLPTTLQIPAKTHTIALQRRKKTQQPRQPSVPASNLSQIPP